MKGSRFSVRLLCLVLIHLQISSVSWASTVEDTSSRVDHVQGGEWAVELAPPTLDSQEAADQFADRLIEDFRESETSSTVERPVIEVLHLEGLKTSPYLDRVLIRLDAAGFEISGHLVDRATFERAQTQAETYVASYSPASFKTRWFDLSRFFGTSQSFTLFAHFFKEGTWKKKFEPEKSITRFAATTSGLSVLYFLTVRWLGATFKNTPMPATSELVATGAVLATYAYFFLSHRREWASFRSQGREVVVDSSQEPGEQIKLKAGRRFFNSICLAQEHILVGVLFALGMTFGSIEIDSMADFFETAAFKSFVAMVSASSYISFEQVVSRQILESEEVRYTDPERSRVLRRAAIFSAYIFYQVVYPFVAHTARFLDGFWKPAVPLATMGLGTWLWKKWIDRGENRAKKENEKAAIPTGNVCAALFRLKATEPIHHEAVVPTL